MALGLTPGLSGGRWGKKSIGIDGPCLCVGLCLTLPCVLPLNLPPCKAAVPTAMERGASPCKCQFTHLGFARACILFVYLRMFCVRPYTHYTTHCKHVCIYTIKYLSSNPTTSLYVSSCHTSLTVNFPYLFPSFLSKNILKVPCSPARDFQ